MEWPDLKHPKPWPKPRQYTPAAWPESELVPLPEGVTPDTPPFATVVESRRTRYSFAPLPDEGLAALMHLTCRVRATLAGRLSFPQSHRPAPSAGAIHPVHVVLHRPGEAALHRYDPI